MNIFQTKSKSLLYVINTPSSHLSLGYYKSEGTGQILLAYEQHNEQAVSLITGNKDNQPATEQDVQERLKLILKDVVTLASKKGVKVPGMDQMKEYFKIK